MTDVDYEKMWKEIIEANYAKTHLLPGEKSVKMFAKEADLTIDSARTILDSYVKENKMNMRFVQQGKARFAAYSPINIEK